jgi:hypothetical protein
MIASNCRDFARAGSDFAPDDSQRQMNFTLRRKPLNGGA